MGTGLFEYDVLKPVAVFLGPSLPRDRAEARLPANYYPPAKMGDVHRLMATGVRVIVLIDGVFHAKSAVWQRELLEAMAQGIIVIGASSMGALRAAELHRLGMLGVGTVFEWYRDGIIDGDDEVALLHADATHDFRPLSQPLVNIRHKLLAAVDRGDLDPRRADALTTHAKQLPFMWRSSDRLMSSDAALEWSDPDRDRVRRVLDDDAIDLKARDARRALDYAATVLDAPRERRSTPRGTPSRFHLATRTRRRGLLHPEGHLVTGEALWDEVREDPALMRRSVAQAAEHFYLSLLAQHWRVECPDRFVGGFCRAWDQRHGVTDRDAWLRANGLTASEREQILHRRAVVGWMLEQGPGAFGLNDSSFSSLPARWLGPGDDPAGGEPSRRARAATLCFLAGWARLRGISCPAEVIEALTRRLEPEPGPTPEPDTDDRRARIEDLACCRWLVHKQPYHFGYTGWSPITAVVQLLQITGEAARIVARRR